MKKLATIAAMALGLVACTLSFGGDDDQPGHGHQPDASPVYPDGPCNGTPDAQVGYPDAGYVPLPDAAVWWPDAEVIPPIDATEPPPDAAGG